MPLAQRVERQAERRQCLALERLDWDSDALFDSTVVRHGFVPYMRDYDVIVEVPAAKPDGSGSYIYGLVTNAYVLSLICHDLRIEQLAAGDPQTAELTSLDAA